MKKQYLILVLALGLSLYLSAKDILTKTLDNGMNVVVKKNTSNQSVGVFCFVHTGSMYEEKFLGTGISHYLEHVVAGGSTAFHSEEYYSNKEKEIGAISNAYTTYDMTAYHMTVSHEHFSEALEMLAEHVQYCAFDSIEVAREQKVIAKEIIMRSTPPYSRMFQRYNEISQDQTNDKYPVIGYVDQFLNLKRSDLVEYYQRRYAPNNMTFVVSGNIDVDKTMNEIVQTFSRFPRRTVEPVYIPVQPVIIGTMEQKEEFDINLPYVMINQVITQDNYKDNYALQAAIDILLSKYSSPIQKKLYEELQLVNYLYAYTDLNRYTGNGKLSIVMEVKETAKIREVLNLFYQEMEKFQKGYFTQDQLNTLFHRYEAEYLLKSKSVEDDCNEIGFNMRQYGVPDNFEFFMANMRKLKPADLNEMVKKYFVPTGKLTFFAVPTGQMNILENDKSQNATVTELIKDEQVKGVTLIHKQNSSIPVVRGTILLPVSSDYESEANYGSISFMANMMLRGSKKYPMEKLTDWLENKAARIQINSGRECMTIEFSCLTSDFKEMQNILVDIMKNPVFDETEMMLYKQEIMANLQRSMSDPETNHSDFRSKMIYANKREQLDSAEENEILQKLTRQDLLNTYKTYFKANHLTIAMVGDQTLAEASAFSQNIYNNLKHQDIDDEIKPLDLKVENKTYTNNYPFEQVNLDINMKGPKVSDPDYVVIRVISAILNGSNGRIHKATRGKNDLSYFAYASEMSGTNYGMFRVTSQTSKEKTEELKNVLLAELDKLMYEKVSQSELSSAVEESHKQLQLYLTDDYLGSYSAYNEMIGLGYDYLTKAVEGYRKITPEDVQRVAQKYFKDRDVIVSVPSEDIKLMMEETE